MRRYPRHAVVLLFLILMPMMASAQVATFDSSTEGWVSVELDCDPFVANECPATTNPPSEEPVPQIVPTHVASSGNPGGYIEVTDPDGLATAGGAQFWLAPPVFLGDKSAKLGGELAFDVFNTCIGVGCGTFQIEEVMFVGGGVTLVFSTATEPNPTSWTSYQLPIEPNQWEVIDSGGQVATEVQLLSVLTSLDAIYIRAEYLTDLDIQGLDNVAFTDGSTPVPIMGVSGGITMVGLLGAVGALGIARRRYGTDQKAEPTLARSV